MVNNKKDLLSDAFQEPSKEKEVVEPIIDEKVPEKSLEEVSEDAPQAPQPFANPKPLDKSPSGFLEELSTKEDYQRHILPDGSVYALDLYLQRQLEKDEKAHNETGRDYNPRAAYRTFVSKLYKDVFSFIHGKEQRYPIGRRDYAEFVTSEEGMRSLEQGLAYYHALQNAQGNASQVPIEVPEGYTKEKADQYIGLTDDEYEEMSTFGKIGYNIAIAGKSVGVRTVGGLQDVVNIASEMIGADPAFEKTLNEKFKSDPSVAPIGEMGGFLGSFLVPFSKTNQLLSTTKLATKLKPWQLGLLSGAVADAFVTTKEEGNIANLVEDIFPESSQNFIIDWLSVEEDDSILDAKLKAAVEGGILDRAIAGTVMALRPAFKPVSKTVKKLKLKNQELKFREQIIDKFDELSGHKKEIISFYSGVPSFDWDKIPEKIRHLSRILDIEDAKQAENKALTLLYKELDTYISVAKSIYRMSQTPPREVFDMLSEYLRTDPSVDTNHLIMVQMGAEDGVEFLRKHMSQVLEARKLLVADSEKAIAQIHERMEQILRHDHLEMGIPESGPKEVIDAADEGISTSRGLFVATHPKMQKLEDEYLALVEENKHLQVELKQAQNANASEEVIRDISEKILATRNKAEVIVQQRKDEFFKYLDMDLEDLIDELGSKKPSATSKLDEPTKKPSVTSELDEPAKKPVKDSDVPEEVLDEVTIDSDRTTGGAEPPTVAASTPGKPGGDDLLRRVKNALDNYKANPESKKNRARLEAVYYSIFKENLVLEEGKRARLLLDAIPDLPKGSSNADIELFLRKNKLSDRLSSDEIADKLEDLKISEYETDNDFLVGMKASKAKLQKGRPLQRLIDIRVGNLLNTIGQVSRAVVSGAIHKPAMAFEELIGYLSMLEKPKMPSTFKGIGPGFANMWTMFTGGKQKGLVGTLRGIFSLSNPSTIDPRFVELSEEVLGAGLKGSEGATEQLGFDPRGLSRLGVAINKIDNPAIRRPLKAILTILYNAPVKGLAALDELYKTHTIYNEISNHVDDLIDGLDIPPERQGRLKEELENLLLKSHMEGKTPDALHVDLKTIKATALKIIREGEGQAQKTLKLKGREIAKKKRHLAKLEAKSEAQEALDKAQKEYDKLKRDEQYRPKDKGKKEIAKKKRHLAKLKAKNKEINKLKDRVVKAQEALDKTQKEYDKLKKDELFSPSKVASLKGLHQTGKDLLELRLDPMFETALVINEGGDRIIPRLTNAYSEAVQRARTITITQDAPEALQGIVSAVQQHTAGRAVLPFFRAGINVASMAVERIPLFNLIMKKQRAAWGVGRAKTAMTGRQLARERGKPLMGLLTLGLGAWTQDSTGKRHKTTKYGGHEFSWSVGDAGTKEDIFDKIYAADKDRIDFMIRVKAKDPSDKPIPIETVYSYLDESLPIEEKSSRIYISVDRLSPYGILFAMGGALGDWYDSRGSMMTEEELEQSASLDGALNVMDSVMNEMGLEGIIGPASELLEEDGSGIVDWSLGFLSQLSPLYGMRKTGGELFTEPYKISKYNKGLDKTFFNQFIGFLTKDEELMKRRDFLGRVIPGTDRIGFTIPVKREVDIINSNFDFFQITKETPHPKRVSGFTGVDLRQFSNPGYVSGSANAYEDYLVIQGNHRFGKERNAQKELEHFFKSKEYKTLKDTWQKALDLDLDSENRDLVIAQAEEARSRVQKTVNKILKSAKDNAFFLMVETLGEDYKNSKGETLKEMVYKSYDTRKEAKGNVFDLLKENN